MVVCKKIFISQNEFTNHNIEGQYKQSFNQGQFLRKLCKRMQGNVEINESSICQAEYKSMNAKLLAVSPSLLHKRCAGYIEDLLLHVDFHQQLGLFINCGQVLEGMGVFVSNTT